MDQGFIFRVHDTYYDNLLPAIDLATTHLPLWQELPTVWHLPETAK
jgi:hypothetical protein